MISSVRLKVTLGVFVALIALLVPFSWLQYQLHRQAELADLRQLASTAGAVARQGLEASMLPHGSAVVQSVVDELAQLSGAGSVYLLSTASVVAASPHSRSNGQFVDPLGPTCQDCHRLPAGSRPASIVTTDAAGQAVFRTMTAIENAPECQACHLPTDRLAGALYMELPMVGLNAHLTRDLRTVLLGAGALTALAALVIYLLVSRLIISPMDRVIEAMRGFSGGNREARAQMPAQDEPGQLAAVFNQMADTIQSQEAQSDRLNEGLRRANGTRRHLLTRLTTAREEERRRLAREIHDHLSQMLTGLSLQLKLCEQEISVDVDAARAHLARASALVRDTIDQSHQLIIELRPTVLDDYGLVPALQDELESRLAVRGITPHLDIRGSLDRLPLDVATTAFRTIQEALTNIIRHAGAHEAWVRAVLADGMLAVSVEDDGVGLPDEALAGGQALGILGMQERAEAMGGRFEIGRRQPNGTRVSFQLPIERSNLE